MPTTTSRLGLTLPLTTENYDISISNGNFTILDSAPANAIICTSTTRPSTPHDGDEILETDSLNFLIRHSGSWKAHNGKVFICTAGTRPGSTLTYGGFVIRETDTGNSYYRNAANTLWNANSPVSVSDTTERNALNGLTEGFLAYVENLQTWFSYNASGNWQEVPNNPRATAVQTVTQSIPNNAFTAVTFNAENVDSHNGHSTSVNTHRYIMPRSGTALFGGGIGFSVNGVGSRGSYWVKNGAFLNNSQLMFPNNGAGLNSLIPARFMIEQFNIGDALELHAYQNSGAGLNTTTGGSDNSHMSIAFISPS